MIEVNNRFTTALARWTTLAWHVAFRIVNLDVLPSYVGTTPTLVYSRLSVSRASGAYPLGK